MSEEAVEKRTTCESLGCPALPVCITHKVIKQHLSMTFDQGDAPFSAGDIAVLCQFSPLKAVQEIRVREDLLHT